MLDANYNVVDEFKAQKEEMKNQRLNSYNSEKQQGLSKYLMNFFPKPIFPNHFNAL